VQGLTVVQRALLQRELDFRSLARFTVAGSLAGAVTGIGLALAGAGVFALVGQLLAAALVRSALVWRASRWRPALRPSVHGASELLGYASRVYLAAIGRFIHRRSDVAVIGYFFGPAPAGLYFLADRVVNTLTETFTRPISTASMPRFSGIQSDPAALRHAYLGCVRASTLVTLPTMALLAVVAEPGLAALGPSWQGVALVTSILCVLGAARGITLLTGPMLFAVARPGLMARLTWLHAALSVPAVLTAALLLREAAPATQTSGVALVRAGIFGLLFAPLSVGLAMRACGASPLELLRQVRAPALGSAAVLLVGVAMLEVCTRLGLGALPTFLLVSGPAAAAAVGVIAAVDSELRSRMRTLLREGRLEAIAGERGDERIGGAP
jgi:O-antigen/teichoic acid export membrane protein